MHSLIVQCVYTRSRANLSTLPHITLHITHDSEQRATLGQAYCARTYTALPFSLPYIFLTRFLSSFLAFLDRSDFFANLSCSCVQDCFIPVHFSHKSWATVLSYILNIYMGAKSHVVICMSCSVTSTYVYTVNCRRVTYTRHMMRDNAKTQAMDR